MEDLNYAISGNFITDNEADLSITLLSSQFGLDSPFVDLIGKEEVFQFMLSPPNSFFQFSEAVTRDLLLIYRNETIKK